jgi:macrolide-specific efflux system membrane fusion protein
MNKIDVSAKRPDDHESGVAGAAAARFSLRFCQSLQRLSMYKFIGLFLLGITAFCQAAAQDEKSDPLPSSGDIVSVSAQAELIHDVMIAVREPGILKKVLVKEGDWVKADQVIAELDRELNELELQSALMKQKVSELKATDDIDKRYSAKSKEVAAATFQRSQSAVANFPNSISKTEIEQLRLELERATLSIEKADFERKVAQAETDLYASEAAASKIKLEYRTVHSPIDGLVVEVPMQEGEWINAGQPLIRIVQLNRMRIKASMPSEQVNQSFIGRRAIFETEGPDNTRYEGTIFFVSPEIVTANKTVQIWFDVDSPDNRLRRRESGQVTILAN